MSKLQELDSPKWAMISNHPYYPDFYMFDTKEEAIKAAEAEIAEMSDPSGQHDDSTVSVVMVVMQANITTAY